MTDDTVLPADAAEVTPPAADLVHQDPVAVTDPVPVETPETPPEAAKLVADFLSANNIIVDWVLTPTFKFKI